MGVSDENHRLPTDNISTSDHNYVLIANCHLSTQSDLYSNHFAYNVINRSDPFSDHLAPTLSQVLLMWSEPADRPTGRLALSSLPLSAYLHKPACSSSHQLSPSLALFLSLMYTHSVCLSVSLSPFLFVYVSISLCLSFFNSPLSNQELAWAPCCCSVLDPPTYLPLPHQCIS